MSDDHDIDEMTDEELRKFVITNAIIKMKSIERELASLKRLLSRLYK
jgi:hypothetical protein